MKILDPLANKPDQVDPQTVYAALLAFKSTEQQGILLATFITKSCLDFAVENMYGYSIDEIFNIIYQNPCLYHIPFQLHLEKYLELAKNEHTYKIITDFKNRVSK